MRKSRLREENESLKGKIAELEKEIGDLRVREQLFHALFEQAEGYSLILDPNTPDGVPLIKEANSAACQYHGYEENELIGKPVGIVDDEEGKGLVKKHTEMIMTGEPFYIENRHMRKDGSVFHAAVNARRIDLDGRPPLILSVERDITERKEARLKLQESEKRFRLAIENMPFPVMIHAVGGKVLSINRMLSLLTGYEYHEIDTIEKWMDKAYGASHGTQKAVIDKLYQRGSGLGNHSGEFDIRTKEGEILRWDLFTSPIGKLPDGSELFLSSAMDLTERVKKDEEIRRLSRFPSENPNPVLRVDARGVLLYANERGTEILPYLSDVNGERLLPGMIEKIVSILDQGQIISEEMQLSDKWYLMSYAPLVDDEYVNIYGMDISESVKLREAVTHSEKLKAIGELAGGIAHDYNNQLGAIAGYLDLLCRDTEGDGLSNEYIEKISDSLDHAKALTAQILSFSRKGKNLHEAVDLNRVVESIILILENSIDKKISLQKDFSVSTAAVMGDPSQIHNALLNIALNGRDAMPDGGILAFSTSDLEIVGEKSGANTPDLEPGNYIRITISDTGHGMKGDVLARAMEPFFTTKEEGKGTGMGLSAAYGALKAHRGDLVIHSEPGKGTRVDMFFPRAALPALPADRPKSKVVIRKGEGKVLLVDDNKAIGDIGARMLRRMGYDAKVFSVPADGIAYFRENWRDIEFVITDMIMPEMKGSELYEKLRDIQRDVKVILTSGYSADGGIQELLDKGIAGFLPKPFVMSDLSEAIGKLS